MPANVPEAFDPIGQLLTPQSGVQPGTQSADATPMAHGSSQRTMHSGGQSFAHSSALIFSQAEAQSAGSQLAGSQLADVPTEPAVNDTPSASSMNASMTK
jgi:hypothetical protein